MEEGRFRVERKGEIQQELNQTKKILAGLGSILWLVTKAGRNGSCDNSQHTGVKFRKSQGEDQFFCRQSLESRTLELRQKPKMRDFSIPCW